MRIKKSILILFGILLNSIVIAQGPERKTLPPSPTAASLGMFGQIEMDYFNGLPSIEIPIYNVQSKAIDLPIKIMYHASGVRPDMHSGWVGQNWSLNCNMSINRIMHGDVDEIVIPPQDLWGNHPYGQSYLNNFNVLDRVDWSSQATLDLYLYNYNPPPNAPSVDLDHRPIPAPDEFSFNFLGYSGSFFLNDKGDWQFKCDKNGGLKLETVDIDEFNIPVLSNNPLQTGQAYKKRMIKSFVLIGGDGTRYYFGGDINSIEFSRPPLALNSYADVYGNYFIANSWYLTKIKTATSEEINFEYQKSNYFQMNYSESWDRLSIGGVTTNGPGFSPSKNLINAVYLTKIIFDKGTLDFNRSLSNDLIPEYPIFSEDYANFLGHKDFSGVTLIPGAAIESIPKYYKLESISLKDLSGTLIKTFDFKYEELTTKRLFLKELKEKGSNSDEKKYSFDYYDDPSPIKRMPNYLQRELDHWGFWNGRNWFKEMLPINTYSPSDVPSYYASREPVLECAISGTLKSIIYPTAGKTVFKYELNDYNGLINYYGANYNSTYNPNLGIDYENLTGPPHIAGGLRISEIENFDNLTSISSKRRFEYKRNAIQSSGILNGLPRYYESGQLPTNLGQLSYSRWSNYSYQPLGFTRGSHISYSQVKEILPDNSSIIRFYSNQDNLVYRDKPMVEKLHSYMYGAGIPYNDLGLSRGLLLEEQYFSANNDPVKKTKYEYNTNPNKEDEYIKYVDFKILPLDIGLNSLDEFNTISGLGTLYVNSVYAYKKFTYAERLSKIEDFNYDINGQNEIKTTKNILYNTNGNVKEENSFTSDGKKIKKITKYNTDYNVSNAFDDASIGIKFLQLQKINDAVIETYTIQSDLNGANPVIISAVLNIYKKDQPLVDKSLKLKLTAPIAYTIGFDSYIDGSGTFIYNSAYEKLLEIKKYSVDGNILETVGRDGIVTSYIWGYNAKYLVARVINKSYDNAIAQSGINQTVLNDPATTDGNMRIELNKLRLISNCFVNSYTYKSLIGISSETDPNGKTIFYEYDPFNRLALIRDKDNNILKKICYNYKGQPESCAGYPFYNIEKTSYFYRNDCPAGYEGSVVGYTVPAHKYSSFTSQLAADQLAQNEIDLNGQNYANDPLNGTCTYIDLCANVVCYNVGEKCIAGTCEMGIQVFTESYYEGGIWFCTYHYEYSDASWSTDYQITSGVNCSN